jgi:MFS family permease
MTRRFGDFSAIRGAFSNRNFAIYAAGNSISLIGLWVQRLAVGWLTWQLTESGFWLGAVAFVDLFPVVVLGPFAGVVADRVDRRLISLVCQSLALIQALVMCALTAFGWITIESLFGLTLFLGIVVAFHQPARLSLVPSLVRPEDLTAAIAISSVMFNMARFVGPAVAGIIITIAGIAPTFGFNAASYTAMIAALIAMRLPPQKRPPGRAGMFADVREGVRYAATHPAIGPILLLASATSMLARPVFELLPGFADAVFARGAGGLATLTSAVGLGAIAGGLWLAQRGSVRGLTTIALLAGAAAGLVIVLFASTGNFWIAAAAMAGAGFAVVSFGIGTQTLIQTAVEDHMRGRVLSLWGVIFRGAPALGALAMGWVSGFAGLGWPVAVGGALCALAALVAFRHRAALIARLET